MGCNCGKPKCNGKCGISPSVLQINNNDCTLFHKVIVPASMGDDATYPPKNGLYKNVLLFYEANGEAYLYSSDGIPTKVTGVATDYNILYNKPSINNVVLVGNKTLTDLGITGAIDDAVSAEAALRYAADQALEQEIDDLRNNPDVVDIVGTYAELQSYDTSKLTDNDIVKVLQDETKNDATTYYKWHKTTSTWEYIGEQGPFYTKSQTDVLLSAKADISSLAPVATSGSYNDLTNKPTIGNATLTVQKNSATVGTFTANSTTDTTIDIAVPTKTSDLTNDGADGTSTYVELDDLDTPLLEGTGEFITLNGTSDCTSLETTLYGNATQKTFTGKNLLDGANPNAESTATATMANNIITVSSVGTDFLHTAKYDVNVSSGDVVRLSTILTSQNGQVFLQGWNGSYWALVDGTQRVYTDGTTPATISYTVGSQYSKIRVLLYSERNITTGTVSAAYKNTILTVNNSDMTYEPFVGGTPMPNPQFPSPVNVVSGAQTVKITGKNLWGGISSYSRSTGDIDFMTNSDGTITASGIATSTAFSCSNSLASSNNIYTTLKAGTYYLSTESTPPTGVSVRIGKLSDGTTLAESPHSFTLAEDTNVYVSLRVASGTNISNGITVKPMLVAGSTAQAYEPYQGQSYEINLGGTNLLNISTVGWGYINSSGVPTGTTNPQNWMSGYIEVKPNTTYTFSLTPTVNTDTYIRLSVAYFDSTQTFISRDAQTSGSSTARSFTTPATCKYVIISAAKTPDWTEETRANYKPQFELGSQATPYAPYTTYAYELAKIGTYQDYIWNDDGTWYIRRAIGKVVLNGTEAGWGIFGNNNAFYSGAYDVQIPPSTATVGAIMANYYTAESETNIYNARVDYGIGISSQNRFLIRNKDITTVANLKSWLGTNTPTVYYALATPTDTEITDSSLIAQLNALKDATGNDGVTNIFSISPTLPANLRVTAYQDSIIPTATTERAGIVKIGDNIDVDSCGVISAVDTTYTAGTGIDITGTTISGMTASVSGTTLILTNA